MGWARRPNAFKFLAEYIQILAEYIQILAEYIQFWPNTLMAEYTQIFSFCDFASGLHGSTTFEQMSVFSRPNTLIDEALGLCPSPQGASMGSPAQAWSHTSNPREAQRVLSLPPSPYRKT